MKKLLFILPLLLGCHPTFNREWARETLQRDYDQVELADYMEYPNCSTAHSYATAWHGLDKQGLNAQGVICCTQFNQCMIFERK